MPRISAKLFLMSQKQDLVVARNRKWHSSNVEQSEKEISGRNKNIPEILLVFRDFLVTLWYMHIVSFNFVLYKEHGDIRTRKIPCP